MTNKETRNSNGKISPKHPTTNAILIFVLFAICIVLAVLIYSAAVSKPPRLVLKQIFRSSTLFKQEELELEPTLSVDLVVAEMLTGTALQKSTSTQSPSPEAFNMPENESTRQESTSETPTMASGDFGATKESRVEQPCSPIEGVRISELASIISQPYDVKNPFSDFGHHGVDFGSYDFHGIYLFDIPIHAIFSGKVAGTVDNRPPLGNVIIVETTFSELPERWLQILQIQPDESLYHLYAHLLEAPDLPIGTRVQCGKPINRLGDSQTIEAHLHLELRIGKSGHTFGSMTFYDTSATEEEMKEYLWWRTSGDFMPVDPMKIFLPSDEHE